MRTKYATTEYNRFLRVKAAANDVYSQVLAYQLTHTQQLEMMTASVYTTKDYKRLTPYWRGYIAGMVDSLSAAISARQVWRLGPASGPVTRADGEWTPELSALSRTPGALYGGHFWVDRDGKPTDKAFDGYKVINANAIAG